MAFFNPYAIIPLFCFTVIIIVLMVVGYRTNKAEFEKKPLTTSLSHYRTSRWILTIMSVYNTINQQNSSDRDLAAIFNFWAFVFLWSYKNTTKKTADGYQALKPTKPPKNTYTELKGVNNKSGGISDDPNDFPDAGLQSTSKTIRKSPTHKSTPQQLQSSASIKLESSLNINNGTERKTNSELISTGTLYVEAVASQISVTRSKAGNENHSNIRWKKQVFNWCIFVFVVLTYFISFVFALGLISWSAPVSLGQKVQANPSTHTLININDIISMDFTFNHYVEHQKIDDCSFIVTDSDIKMLCTRVNEEEFTRYKNKVCGITYAVGHICREFEIEYVVLNGTLLSNIQNPKRECNVSYSSPAAIYVILLILIIASWMELKEHSHNDHWDIVENAVFMYDSTPTPPPPPFDPIKQATQKHTNTSFLLL